MAALAGRGRWTVQIVKRAEATKDFQLIKRRWVVERSFAWLDRNRRLART